MNAPVTRRALLGATAAVGAVALPTIAEARMRALDPDANLFALLERWREARATFEASWRRFEDVSDRTIAARPPHPEALQWRTFDFPGTSYGRWASDPCGQTGCRQYLSRGVEWLRRLRPPPQWGDLAEARRQEILSAFDAWVRETKAFEDAAGYAAAEETLMADIEVLNAAEEDAKLCPPRTLAGLARKAAWVADLIERDICEDDLGEVFARQVAGFRGAVS